MIPETAKTPLSHGPSTVFSSSCRLVVLLIYLSGLSTIEEDEDVLIVYLDQQSPRGRRKHKSSSSSGDKDKGEDKLTDKPEERSKKHRKSRRTVSDDKVVLSKRSKSTSARVDTEELTRKDTHTSSRTADVEGPRRRGTHKSSRTTEPEVLQRKDTHTGSHFLEPEPVQRKDSHRSDKKERKGTWHGHVPSPLTHDTKLTSPL